jgi:hypothetical protein
MKRNQAAPVFWVIGGILTINFFGSSTCFVDQTGKNAQRSTRKSSTQLVGMRICRVIGRWHQVNLASRNRRTVEKFTAGTRGAAFCICWPTELSR